MNLWQRKAQERVSGIELIAAERERQVSEEGWTTQHDDGHSTGELAWAAVCYTAPGPVRVEHLDHNGTAFRDPWPFPAINTGGRYGGDWDRRKSGNVIEPMPESGAERIDYLVKAGALIAAEIDRLTRAALAKEDGEP